MSCISSTLASVINGTEKKLNKTIINGRVKKLNKTIGIWQVFLLNEICEKYYLAKISKR